MLIFLKLKRFSGDCGVYFLGDMANSVAKTKGSTKTSKPERYSPLKDASTVFKIRINTHQHLERKTVLAWKTTR